MNCKKIDEMKKEFNFEENAEVCCACDENEFDDDSLDIEMDKIFGILLEDYEKGMYVDKMEVFQQPDQDAVKKIIKKLLMILYPGYYREKLYRTRNTHSKLSLIHI